MSKSLAGTKTEKHLLMSFAGESQAFQRYHMFANQARKEGYNYLANIFEDNAKMEQSHAQRFFSFMEGRPVEITATFPAGKVLTTIENIKNSIAGETEEADEAYPHFSKVAAEEGFPQISKCFAEIAKIEALHSLRFKNILKLLENESVYEMSENTEWICMKCGYVHKGSKALKGCPVCLEVNSFMPLDYNFYAAK
ncbi:Rubrerythrin_2 [Hexamita inflata]|uniref:Rubrerythrin 2 n=1 Tax=Hexamita inflata TaxID=28002 RepID=A0AA86RBS8_9EUKA|nr:Rubrerythrin 2 [Hexamita inflata]